MPVTNTGYTVSSSVTAVIAISLAEPVIVPVTAPAKEVAVSFPVLGL